MSVTIKCNLPECNICHTCPHNENESNLNKVQTVKPAPPTDELEKLLSDIWFVRTGDKNSHLISKLISKMVGATKLLAERIQKLEKLDMGTNRAFIEVEEHIEKLESKIDQSQT